MRNLKQDMIIFNQIKGMSKTATKAISIKTKVQLVILIKHHKSCDTCHYFLTYESCHTKTY